MSGQDAVELSERQARELAELSPDGVLVVDEDGHVAFANGALARLLGVEDPTDLVGTTIADRYPPQARPAVAARMADLERSVTVNASLEALLADDGRVVPVEVSSAPIDRDGRPAVLSVVRDVSERLDRDAELLEVQQRHRLSFDNAPIGQGLLGLDGKWLAVNQALCNLLGRSAAELRDSNFQDLTHPDDLDTDRGLMEQLVAGAIPNYSLEKRYLRPDGTVVWAALHRSLVRDQAGVPLYFVSQIADVTDIKARERALAAAEARWWTAFDGAPVGMVELDLAGGILQANDALADLLGQPSGQLEGGRLVDHLHPDERPAVAARLAAIAGGAPGRAISERRLLPGGSGERWVSIRAGRIHGTRDSPDRVLVHILDITAEHQQRERRDAAYARFSALVEHSSDAITVIDADGIVRYASPAFATLTGARISDPTIGTRVDAQVHPEDRDAVRRIARSVLAEDGRTMTFECRLHHRTNGWRNIEVTATNRLREPAVHGIVVNARDITERVEAAARLAHQAMHDTLTGLPNRALFLDRLDNAVARAERSGRPCAVLFLDLDRFKKINDSLGHAAGDQVLTTVAERLAGEVRPGDSVARLGGDEFVVLAENVDHPRVALEIAERVRARLSEPIALADRLVATGCSVGIALSDRHARGGLLQEADMALYRAKSAGGNRCELYDQAMRAQARQRLEIEELIRGAVGTDNLQVHFQPIVDLQTGRMNGTEALARILHPDGHLVGPAEFLAVAEESGLIIPLGAAVLRLAAAQQARWGQGRTNLRRVAVNISARELSSDEFVGSVSAALSHWALPPDALCLELTESALIDSGTSAQQHMHEVKALGVTLALDNFGTGWSSLAYLRRFPIDILKLDRTLVAGLGTDDGATEVVKAVIGLGRSLGLTTIAEGVETEGQSHLLREFGCDYGQGHLYGHPQLAERFPPQD